MTSGNPNILLVEDNSGEALLFKRALRRRNAAINVTHAATGELALQALLSKSEISEFHLVLLDLNLPTISGLEVLKRMRSTATLSNTPVVVLSSSQAESDIQAAYASAANGYVVKPVSPEGYETLANFVDESYCC